MGLKILVCVKPVPDPKEWSKISLDPVTKTLRRGGIASVLNPLDKNALEQALQLKETVGGTVTVISMAPPSATENLTEALAMGADEAVLLSDRAFAGADTLATSYVLSEGIKKAGGAELVLCGNESLDGSTAQVGPQLAEFLGFPHAVQVGKVDLSGRVIRVKTGERAFMTVLEMDLPALVAVTKDINTPRFTSLMGILGARSKPTTVWSAADLGVDPAGIGLEGSPTRVAGVFMAEMKRRAEVLPQNPEEAAVVLLRRLRELGAL